MKGHKINESRIKMFKKDDEVRYKGRIGIVVEIKDIDLGWTTYKIYKVEFEFDEFEWINERYLVK